MNLKLAAFLLLTALTVWMPVGSRVHLTLAQALIPGGWYLPLTGCLQLGMAVSALVLYRSHLKRLAMQWLPAAVSILVLGLLFPGENVPEFVSGVVTIAVGILFLIQSGMHLEPLDIKGISRTVLWVLITCLGMIPGVGVLSMAMLAGLVTGLREEQAYSLAVMTSLWIQAVSGFHNLALLPAAGLMPVLACLLTAAFGFVLSPVLIRAMRSWFSRHTLLLFGLWRIAFGAVFLLVFCVF